VGGCLFEEKAFMWREDVGIYRYWESFDRALSREEARGKLV